MTRLDHHVLNATGEVNNHAAPARSELYGKHELTALYHRMRAARRCDATLASLRECMDRLAIGSAEDVRGAAEYLHQAAFSFVNLRTFACADVTSSNPMVDSRGRILNSEVFGWGESEKQRVRAPDLAPGAPLTRVCRIEGEPFWCDRDGIHTRNFNWQFACDIQSPLRSKAPASAVIVIPIHLPCGQLGVVTYQSMDPDRQGLTEEFHACGDLLSLFARTFIAGYVNLTRPRVFPDVIALSKHEIACPRWVAAGKTDREMAALSGRRIATIRFHMRNVGLKLKTATRSHAVFRAVQLGYLGTQQLYDSITGSDYRTSQLSSATTKGV